MSVDHQQLQTLLQRYEEIQAKRQKYRREVEEFEAHRNQLARARGRAEAKRVRNVSEDVSEDLDADRKMSPSQESYSSSSDGGQDLTYPVPPPSVAESPSPAPAAPSEETLRRFATTVAYSSYSRLCGTSDGTLIRHLFEDELRKEPTAILGPKKMIEISQGEHNIAYLWQELFEGAASPFATNMAEARRRIDPEVPTDNRVRRLGPAEILDDSLPIYWIVTVGQQGVLDWEEGCSLAQAYRHVFEQFGADDVHCLIFECQEYETDLAGADGQKVFVME